MSAKELGLHIRDLLVLKGIETPFTPRGISPEATRKIIAEHFGQIIQALGLYDGDDSIEETPSRVGKMYAEEIFYGLDYANFPKCTTVQNTMRYDEMVSTKCSIRSVCEHHFVPFIGHAHIAYIPGTKVLGLSKFNRIADFFARRPQIQERLTEQISATLQYILETEDTAIVIKAQHMCVQLRGVKDENSYTTTSKMSGKFRTVQSLREEFLSLTR